MHILVPVIRFPADVKPAGLPITEVSEGLAERGHEVSVITSFPTAAAFWRRRWDIVLCPNGSFATGLCAWILRSFKRAPFIYSIQDIDPDVPARGRSARKAMENVLYRNATHVTVTTLAMRRTLIEKRVPDNKISVIPNFADTEFIRPLPRDNDFAREHGLSGQFVIACAGDVGSAPDLLTLVKTAHILRGNRNLLFLIAGDGGAKAELQKEAADRQLDNLRFMPLPPRTKLPWLRASSDVQVSCFRRGAAAGSVSSEIFETMASGRPLIAAAEEGSAVDQIVGTAHCGIRVTPGEAEDLALAIVQLYHDPALCARMGESGRWYVEKYHSKQAAVAHYEALLKEIVRR